MHGRTLRFQAEEGSLATITDMLAASAVPSGDTGPNARVLAAAVPLLAILALDFWCAPPTIS